MNGINDAEHDNFSLESMVIINKVVYRKLLVGDLHRRDLIVLAMNDKERNRSFYIINFAQYTSRQGKVWLQLLLAPVENMAGVWPWIAFAIYKLPYKI